MGWWNIGIALAATIAIGCSLSRGGGGPARAPADLESLVHEARRSIQTRRWSPAPLHDALGVIFEPSLPAGFMVFEAISSFPDPGGLQGGPGSGSGSGPGSTLHGRSYLYDNALLALDRTRGGDAEGAAAILATVAALQLPDGAWGFSFGLDDSFYDAGYIRAGTVAFVVYAFARYAARFGDHRFRAIAGRGAGWLLRQRDPATGLVRAGRGLWLEGGRRFDAAHSADFAATEHQIDAFFALAALGGVDPAGPWLAGAAGLESAILEQLWRPDEGRFLQGLSPRHGPDDRSALDAAGSWGALFHLAAGRHDEARRALEWVERHHRLEKGYKPWADGPAIWFVEGSAGHALASFRLEPAQERGSFSLEELSSLAREVGLPLPYADRGAEDFPALPAAAPTLWYLLAAEEIGLGGAPFLWTEQARE